MAVRRLVENASIVSGASAPRPGLRRILVATIVYSNPAIRRVSPMYPRIDMLLVAALAARTRGIRRCRLHAARNANRLCG